MKYTEDQQKVLDAPVKNLLVSAAAGSGKTEVLVERIMRRLVADEKVSLDRLLIVTFTRNSAADLREKINKKLNLLINDGNLSEDVRRRLYAQKIKLPYADITTIDGFAGKIVKKWFYAIDIDPNYRIGDTIELKLMLEDVIDDVLFKEYEKGEEGFVSFMMAHNDTKNDDTVIKLITEVLTKEDSMADADKFYESLRSNYAIETEEELENSRYFKYLKNMVPEVLEEAVSLYNEAVDISENHAGFEEFAEQYAEECKKLAEIKLDEETPFPEIKSGLKKALELFKKAPSLTGADAETEEIKGRIAGFRNKAKKVIKDHLYRIDFDRQEFFEANRKCLKEIDELIRLCRIVREEYTREKLKNNILSFADVNHYALEIVKKHCGEIAAQYDEIMIDEYQDSNDLQEVLLGSISGYNGKNMFMVGDVKQSIYGFRMAKPRLFLEKYKNYSYDQNSEEQKIDLAQNFRSSLPVIHTVNMVFRRAMTEGYSGIAYDENAELKYGGIYDSTPEINDQKSEFIVLVPDKKGKRKDKNRIMIEALAEKIEELKKTMRVKKEKSENEFRELKNSDICIISFSVKNYAAELSDYFMDRNIAVELKAREGFFKTREIMHMLSFLKILDNPYQDIELAAVLRSYFGKIKDDEFARLKIFERKEFGKKTYLFNVIEKYAGLDNALAVRLKIFIEKYNELKKLAVYTGIRELIGSIYKSFSYYDYIRLLPAGRQRIANLDMLLVKATDFEKTGSIGIVKFLSYIDKIEKNELDEGEAGVADSTDAIKVMTIHGSKGLEFPLVIMVENETQFQGDRSYKRLRVHHEYGCGAYYYNPEDKAFVETPQCAMLDNMNKRDNMAERIRDLYVGMTRAKQKLIMYTVRSDLYDEKKPCKAEWLSRQGNDCFTNDEIGSFKSFDDILGPVFADVDNEYVKYIEKPVGSENEKDEAVDELCLPEIDRIKAVNDYVDSFVYAHKSVNLPVKYSVSELKHAAIDEYMQDTENNRIFENTAEKKEFKNKKEANIWALRGTAYHELLKTLVMSDVCDRAGVERLIDEYVEKDMIKKEVAEIIKPADIVLFLNSELCRRMRMARDRRELFLEQPFVYGIEARNIPPLYKGDEKVLLQGVIDAFFIENGEAVIVDYKTDNLRSYEDKETALKNLYSKQLECYEKAVGSILKKNVKEKILYSFYLNSVVYC